MQPLHVIKEYSTEKGVPICLHENKFFRMMFNGYFHYLDPIRYGRGVITVPRFANGDLILVRLRRAPALGFALEFPRGGVEEGESLEDGAARELLEETGYSADLADVRCIGKVAADSATLNGATPVYWVPLQEGRAPGAFDTEEIDSVLRVSQAQFEEMVRQGEIFDGQTLAAWCLFRAQMLGYATK